MTCEVLAVTNRGEALSCGSVKDECFAEEGEGLVCIRASEGSFSGNRFPFLRGVHDVAKNSTELITKIKLK